jgi:uroporphyrinogen decarboxylase
MRAFAAAVASRVFSGLAVSEIVQTESRARSDAARGFGGLRVVLFESRMAEEAAKLVDKAGGLAVSAPSLREVALADNPQALAFAADLVAGRFDAVVFLTGVGTRYLFDAMETVYARAALVAALAKTTTIARGPKPVRVLRDLGVPVAVTVPEPNTWRELLAAVEESPEGLALAGARVAVQEYGVTNERLLAGLRERGAAVTAVASYRWALPDDLRPLRSAVRSIADKAVDVALFTSATQVRHLLAVAAADGLEAGLRDGLAQMCVASIGPVCTEALVEAGVGVDLEPAHPKLGFLVREAAEKAAEIVTRKRAPARARVVPAPRDASKAAAAAFDDAPFLRACRREPTPYTPVWLMRQAGRYMQEYRELRARVPFIELCKRPELAAEAAVTAAARLHADAAILFSDILLILEPMGLDLEYLAGEGPSIGRTVHSAADVDRLRRVDPRASLGFVADAVDLTRRELPADVPLIGFSGAPFTLASYAIEGGGSRNYVATKTLMYSDPGAWDALMSLIADAVAGYLNMQIEAGCQAVQLFDSWVGCLSPLDYERYVLPHTKKVFDALPSAVPAIHFGTDTATLLDVQLAAGGTVLGIDHRFPIRDAFERFGSRVAIQGNLDPTVLFADPAFVRKECARVLADVAGRPGHVFNLGHGILPTTPVDNVIALVEAVHELSARRRG